MKGLDISKGIFYRYERYLPNFMLNFINFSKRLAFSSAHTGYKPSHRRRFNLRKFHNSINDDTSSNRIMYQRRRANGQLLYRTGG